MITIVHCYNEIINHCEKLGGGKLPPHKNKNKIRKQPGRRCWGVVGQNEKRQTFTFAEMCSLNWVAEKGEERVAAFT